MLECGELAAAVVKYAYAIGWRRPGLAGHSDFLALILFLHVGTCLQSIDDQIRSAQADHSRFRDAVTKSTTMIGDVPLHQMILRRSLISLIVEAG